MLEVRLALIGIAGALGACSSAPEHEGMVDEIAAALTAPSAPIITEPNVDGKLVNGADVHMETAPFADADPGP